MNKRNHVINAVLLSVGISLLLTQQLSLEAVRILVAVAPPIVLGALFPDLDTAFGTHRKTFHNVWVLGVAVSFPYLFGNLYYVWIGVLTHYILDLLGNRYGMGAFYPIPGFYDVPVGVSVDSAWATPVTLLVTALELGAVFLLVAAGLESQLSTPGLPAVLEQVFFLFFGA